MPSNQPIHSFHIFLFPFQWDFVPAGNSSFKARTDLFAVMNLMKKNPASRAGLTWEQHQFNWKRDFNETVYFYKFARETLFPKSENGQESGLQYHISGSNKALEYRIALDNANGCITYQLEIEELTLNFFDTGIGFLGFHLNNRSHPGAEAILHINDFGRRIFPQFIGTSPGYETKPPKEQFLADRIELFDGDRLLCGDDFSGLAAKLVSNTDPEFRGFLLPGFIIDLFPVSVAGKTKNSPAGSVAVEPLLDDRMFVACWASDDTWSNSIKPSGSDFPHLRDNRWHRFIFVDGKSPGLANNALLQALNERHTHTRWLDYGTLYGASRYAFVVLTDESGFSHNVIRPHLQSMYFQIALLCLLQRGSIIRFSDEIARLARNKEQKTDNEARSLYEKYLRFINKVYFREVTAQEQGIELYNLLQEKMEIERDVKNLQAEIHDFFNLLKLASDERQTNALNLLTVIGSSLLVPTLMLAYFGMTTFPDGITCKEEFTVWVAWLSFLGSLSGFLAARAWVKNWPIRNLLWLLPALFLIASTMLPFCPRFKRCIPLQPPKTEIISSPSIISDKK